MTKYDETLTFDTHAERRAFVDAWTADRTTNISAATVSRIAGAGWNASGFGSYVIVSYTGAVRPAFGVNDAAGGRAVVLREAGYDCVVIGQMVYVAKPRPEEMPATTPEVISADDDNARPAAQTTTVAPMTTEIPPTQTHDEPEYAPHPDTIASKLAYQLSGADIGERIVVRTAEAPGRRSMMEATITAVHQHREVVHVELDFEHQDIHPTTLAVHPSAQVDILTRPAKPSKKTR